MSISVSLAQLRGRTLELIHPNDSPSCPRTSSTLVAHGIHHIASLTRRLPNLWTWRWPSGYAIVHEGTSAGSCPFSITLEHVTRTVHLHRTSDIMDPKVRSSIHSRSRRRLGRRPTRFAADSEQPGSTPDPECVCLRTPTAISQAHNALNVYRMITLAPVVPGILRMADAIFQANSLPAQGD